MRKFPSSETQEKIKNIDTIEKLEDTIISICKDYIISYPPQQLKKTGQSSFWNEIKHYLIEGSHTNQGNANKIIKRLNDYKLFNKWPTEEKIISLEELKTISDYERAIIIRRNLKTIETIAGDGNLYREISIAICSFYVSISLQPSSLFKILDQLRGEDLRRGLDAGAR